MRERFSYDPKENILFINFAGLRIDSRAQVDEMAGYVRDAYERSGRRMYAVVNYEGTEIAPEIVDYYGERIKQLQDTYALSTVRYAASGFTRSTLRYIGAAKDLESNIFETRAEAIRAIQEVERRTQSEGRAAGWAVLNPRRSLCGQVTVGWLAAFGVLLGAWAFGTRTPEVIFAVAGWTLLGAAALTGAVLFCKVVNPLRRMEDLAWRLAAGSQFEPVAATSGDEIGRLAHALNETAHQLRRDIERLSGLYHISLMMGTGTEVSKITELLTRKIARLLDAEMCFILLYDEREQSLYAQLPGYGVSDEHLRRLRTNIAEPSIATWVLKTGEPYVTNDAVRDALISRAAADLIGVREMLTVPLQAGDRALGTLAVVNKAGGFLEEDKQLVMIFASQAAQLLANAQHVEAERRLAQQLIASERLAAVGELVAGVAHEVRNPLFGITTTLSALARRLDDREAARPFLEVVNKEVAQLNHLMEQLLEHSRPVRLDTDFADLREVIGEAVAEFRDACTAKGIALDCECAADLPRLRLDRRKMHGVFVNLLDNALQHTPAGGRLSICATALERAVCIAVRDTGAGIAPENLGKVFEPFFTTRAAGTGLGLAIVRKSIHDHGGTINAASEPGRGASFIIELPITD